MSSPDIDNDTLWGLRKRYSQRLRDGFDPDDALELVIEESYGDGQKAERERIATNCMLAAVLADTHEERKAYQKLARFVRGEE